MIVSEQTGWLEGFQYTAEANELELLDNATIDFSIEKLV